MLRSDSAHNCSYSPLKTSEMKLPSIEDVQEQTVEAQWQQFRAFRWPFAAVAPCLEQYRGFTLIRQPPDASEHLRQEYQAFFDKRFRGSGSRWLRILPLFLFAGMVLLFVEGEKRNGLCGVAHNAMLESQGVLFCSLQWFRICTVCLGVVLVAIGWSRSAEHEYTLSGIVTVPIAILSQITSNACTTFDLVDAPDKHSVRVQAWVVAFCAMQNIVVFTFAVCFTVVFTRRCRVSWVNLLYALMLRDRIAGEEKQVLLKMASMP